MEKKNIYYLPINLKNKTEILLRELYNSNKTNNFLYLTSNFCKIKDFKVTFLNYYKNSSPPNTETLKSLALKIVYERSSKKVIDDVDKYLILVNLIKKHNNEGRKQSSQIGIAKVIFNFIKELKISSFTQKDIPKIENILENFNWKFEENKKTIIFALKIFQEYETLLNKENMIDMEDIYNEAAEYVENKDFQDVVVENILEIPEYQKRFWEKIINFSHNFYLFYLEPENFSLDARELIIENSVNFFKNIGLKNKKLLQGETYKPIIECFNFPTKEDEVKGIINLIQKELKQDKNLTLDDLMITCPNMLSYRDYFKRVFTRFEIPTEIIPGYSLIFDSSIMSIFEFFIFSDTYDWNNLMNILLSPYFKKIEKKEAVKFSETYRNKFENTGFSKEDFEKINDKILKVIKLCLNLIKNKQISKLKNWKTITKKILQKTGWEPFEKEIKYEFERIIDKLIGEYFITKEEYINLINRLLELIEVESSKGEGIRISGIIESLGIEKKICFFCGATEENLPGSSKTNDFLLPEKIKRELNLDFFDKKIARDRADFERIKNEHQKIVFTYPSKIENLLQMKSLFIFDIPTKAFFQDIKMNKPQNLFNITFNLEKFYKIYMVDKKFKISVIDLELFLKCPYKFYLKKVEKIYPYVIPQYREIPKEWGNLIHESISEVIPVNIKIKQQDIQKLKENLNKKVEEKLNRYYQENKISEFYKKVLEIRKEEVLKKFEFILAKQVNCKFLEFEKEINYENENIILTGKIDILKEKNNRFVIIDIKTGTTQKWSLTETDFIKNKNIQIPLYIWIFSKKMNYSFYDLTAEIWNLSFFEDQRTIIKHFNFSNKEKFYYMENIEKFINEISTKVKMGQISFYPEENNCEYYCEYKELCIYGE